MINGTVKWFNNQKGFGFLVANGKEYFVHFKDIEKQGYKSLTEGDKVSFEPQVAEKGPLAKCVKLIEE